MNPSQASHARFDDSFLQQAPLDELLDAARQRYRVRFETLKVCGHALEVLQIEDMHELIEQIFLAAPEAERIDLPFWAKIWPTSLLLGYFIERLPLVRDGRAPKVLELGAGVGVCGLLAAKRGLPVVISDIDQDALLFSRINVLKNGLDGLAQIRRVDFLQDRLDERFDYILGSEVMYIEKSYRALTKFLLAHLASGGEAILAKNHQRKASKFFRLAEEEFLIDEKVVGCKSGDGGEAEHHLSNIYRLRAKKDVRA